MYFLPALATGLAMYGTVAAYPHEFVSPPNPLSRNLDRQAPYPRFDSSMLTNPLLALQTPRSQRFARGRHGSRRALLWNGRRQSRHG